MRMSASLAQPAESCRSALGHSKPLAEHRLLAPAQVEQTVGSPPNAAICCCTHERSGKAVPPV